ncbi:MAG: YggS family pyridoxal phosphate-dependent enzyme [Candidatus Pacebacteria bacterium]|nr:YggS family pyridoxal phosphate-dependent enzyme [Candidatus Paceibacterota bacterium]
MTDSTIASKIDSLRSAIDTAAKSAGRDPNSVTLIAVAKTHDWAAVQQAMVANQFVFGENRVQEALSKYPKPSDRPTKMRLHLIGSLQSNKARQAAEFFDSIDSLDRESLALELVKIRDSGVKMPRLLIQVNTGAEPQKSGVLGTDADHFIATCLDQWNLPVKGLMCVPPLGQAPEPHFAMLAAIGKKFNLPQLSMGMSHDFESAIRLGATAVRVGTAIFGTRPKILELAHDQEAI